RLGGPSSTTSEPSSRSCLQSNQWPPIAMDTRPDVQTPAGPLAPVLQVKIACSCLSWLHSLKIRSLRDSRGDSPSHASTSHILSSLFLRFLLFLHWLSGCACYGLLIIARPLTHIPS